MRVENCDKPPDDIAEGESNVLVSSLTAKLPGVAYVDAHKKTDGTVQNVDRQEVCVEVSLECCVSQSLVPKWLDRLQEFDHRCYV